MSSHRFAVNVTPKPGILDPQGKAVEGSLDHLDIEGVHAVRVGRRVELTVDATDETAARAVVERVDVIPFEAVVRGFLAGSGWKGYQQTGHVCGIRLPRGLRESDRLPEPIFTPATKAEGGAHDENVSFETMAQSLGEDLARRVRGASLDLYRSAIGVAARAGILIADTKFEFGLRPGTNELILIDEVLTPDSSRFWDASIYEPGRPQASFDKQFVRDWLETLPWDKSAPGPALPDVIVEGTRERYVAAFERITGASFERYLREDVIAR
jgi:phosphoribosylaminoimidazole-succinocarboxamide synthase